MWSSRSRRIRGAPHVGFSATILKIKSRISFEIRCLPPRGRQVRDRTRQYSLNPDRCHSTTVSGQTRMRDWFQPDQTCRATTQNSLSNRLSLGLRCRRLNTTSCCRNARFSRTRLRRVEKRRVMVPRTSRKIWSMPRVITCGRNAATRSKCLIAKPSKVLARDKPVHRRDFRDQRATRLPVRTRTEFSLITGSRPSPAHSYLSRVIC